LDEIYKLQIILGFFSSISNVIVAEKSWTFFDYEYYGYKRTTQMNMLEILLITFNGRADSLYLSVQSHATV
jgi:hypothetical protein